MVGMRRDAGSLRGRAAPRVMQASYLVDLYFERAGKLLILRVFVRGGDCWMEFVGERKGG